MDMSQIQGMMDGAKRLQEELGRTEVEGVSGAGMVEVRAESVALHNRADAMPFPIDDETMANEESRLQHRFVDLRRAPMQRALRLRHRVASAAEQRSSQLQRRTSRQRFNLDLV